MRHSDSDFANIFVAKIYKNPHGNSLISIFQDFIGGAHGKIGIGAPYESTLLDPVANI